MGCELEQVRHVDPIERAIRNALSKGDAGDAAYRQRVYASARAALEKSATGPNAPAAEVGAARLSSLAAAIGVIEEEFAPAVGRFAELSEPVISIPEDPVRSAPSVEHAPQDLAEYPVNPPQADTSTQPERLAAQEARRPRRRAYARFFVWATILAFLGMGAWWVATSGILMSALERDTSVPNPPAKLGEDEFEPKNGEAGAPAADAVVDWVDIFTPDNPAAASAPSGASAEVAGAGDGKALRISSGKEGAAVLFDVGEGVLEQMAGKKAVFDIVARSVDGNPVQIAVTCNFGELGDCGRRRYDITRDKADYLFEVLLPAVKPGAAGSIAIIADIEGAGRPVDIHAVRVSAAPEQ